MGQTKKSHFDPEARPETHPPFLHGQDPQRTLSLAPPMSYAIPVGLADQLRILADGAKARY
jgi:hypothetical protein